MRISFVIAISVFCLSLEARGQDTPPLPTSKKVVLEQLDVEQLPEMQDVKSLESKASDLKKDVKNLEQQLTDKTNKVVVTQKEIISLQNDIDETQATYYLQLEKLKNMNSELSDVIIALHQIKRFPDEAIFLDPEQTKKIITTLTATKSITPQLLKKIKTLRSEIDTLVALKDKKLKTKNLKEQRTKDLKLATKELKVAVDERNKNYEKTVSDLELRKKEAERAAKYANSLQDLIKNLSQKNRDAESLKDIVKRKDRNSDRSTSAILKLGQLPVAGTIKISFGEENDIGAKSDGLQIIPNSDGFVVTPVAGKIRYTGRFKNYGKMIIVEHEKNYYSLIAGLDKIDTVVGQVLSAGEPIGQINRSNDKTLYYELRKQSKPVDPIGGLKRLL